MTSEWKHTLSVVGEDEDEPFSSALGAGSAAGLTMTGGGGVRAAPTLSVSCGRAKRRRVSKFPFRLSCMYMRGRVLPPDRPVPPWPAGLAVGSSLTLVIARLQGCPAWWQQQQERSPD